VVVVVSEREAVVVTQVVLSDEVMPAPARSETTPRTAALHWFGAAYLLILGMSFLILPRGPINPLFGLIWLRGPLLALSGLALLWLCTLRLSGRASVVAHVLAAGPPLAVGVWYLFLQSYSPAATLLLLGLAVALSPFAPREVSQSAWQPDALGIVLGLALAVDGLELLLRPTPPVVPYGIQSALAVVFVLSGAAVTATHLTTRTPAPAAWIAHLAAGLSVLVLVVVLAVGLAPLLWVLNASGLLVAVAIALLPWLSGRAARMESDTVRVRLAIVLFSGSLVTLLIAVPVVLTLAEAGGRAEAATRQAAFGVTLALVILAAIVGWFLARQLVVPLARLIAGVERIAAGEHAIPLRSGAPREIEEVAAAVESMAERLDEQAAQEERNRLARDLHDSITQALFAAALKAEALSGNGTLPESVAASADEVRRLTRGALAQMRTLVMELRAEHHETVPIGHLLLIVAEATEARARITVEVKLTGDGALPKGLHSTVYRVTQEALNNAARHSRADHVTVGLQTEPGHVRLLVHDDGCGFVVGADPPGHLGLRSMRERACEAGAELWILSAPGEGTYVILEWSAEQCAVAIPAGSG
jgi:signal transduction histidine kinase